MNGGERMTNTNDSRRVPPLWAVALLFVATFALTLCPVELRLRLLGALGVASAVTASACLAYLMLATRGAREAEAPTIVPSPVAKAEPEELPAISKPDETPEPTDEVTEGDAEEEPTEPEAETEPESVELVVPEEETAEDLPPEVVALNALLDLIQGDGVVRRIDAGIDPQELVESLAESPDVFAALRSFVGMVRTAEAGQDEGVCAAASALARWLIEAGLFGKEVELPNVTCVVLERTGLVYLRINAPRLTYLAKVRVLAIEAALNRMLLVSRNLVDLGTATEEQVYRADVEVETGIAKRMSREQGSGNGEWDVRHEISLSIESWPLPQRLVTTFRTNVAGGTAAAEVQLPPVQAFPRSRWSEALKRVVPASNEMRMRAASEYAARTCLMVAATMLHSSQSLDHVFVAGITDDGLHHSCRISLELKRERLSFVDRPDRPEIPNPIWVLSALGACMDPWRGTLGTVRQRFSLDEERFCPRSRYEEVGLSDRLLDDASAEALGAHLVSDLQIDEEAHREHVAADIVRGLSGSVESDVRLILSSAANNPDPTVREAALRTVAKLIDGTLSDDGPLGIRDEFVDGDEITDALRRAVESFLGQNPKAVAGTLAEALEIADAMGTYEDTQEREHRCFRSYAERALYNRLFSTPGREVSLASDAYLAAHIMLSDALASLKDVDGALEHARRALELDPLDERAHLRIAAALEAKGDLVEAAAQMSRLLDVAYQPEVICLAYWKLSQIAWNSGDVLLADACMRMCLRYSSGGMFEPMASFATMLSDSAGSVLSNAAPELIEGVLHMRNVPVAPTDEVVAALEECTRAAVDAEVFPAARDLARALGKLTADDVIWGIARSIEHEPDR